MVESIRSGLWFVPSLLVATGVALAVLLVELDTVVGAATLARFPRLFGAGAEGTRGMLEAIAGAMVTIAGVTFSITIVALSLTSSQYSSRVLRNFMRDRSNQTALGTFVGIYAYCLIVLRAIRGGEQDPFVPSLATLGAIVLAFVGIAMLIHYIHHVSTSIQAARILAAIYEETAGTLAHLYPEPLGEAEAPPREAEAARLRTREEWVPVCADRTGYLQSVDADSLLRWACERDRIVQLTCRIGDFVIADQPLCEVAGGPLDDADARALRRTVAIGEQRTVTQDLGFGIRQVVDVAIKALSPGVNDSTTAVMCVDRLGGLMLQLAGRDIPSPYRQVDGRLRVIAPTQDFAMLVDLAFDEIRWAAREQPVVLGRLGAVLGRLLAALAPGARQATVLQALEALRETMQAVPDERSRRRLLDALLRELTSA